MANESRVRIFSLFEGVDDRARFAPRRTSVRAGAHDPRRRRRRVRRRRHLGGDSRHQLQRRARLRERRTDDVLRSAAFRSRSRRATARTTRASGGTIRGSRTRTPRRSATLPIDPRGRRADRHRQREVRYKDRDLSSSTRSIGSHGELDDRRPRRRSLSRAAASPRPRRRTASASRSSTTRWRRACSASPTRSTR